MEGGKHLQEVRMFSPTTDECFLDTGYAPEKFNVADNMVVDINLGARRLDIASQS